MYFIHLYIFICKEYLSNDHQQIMGIFIVDHCLCCNVLYRFKTIKQTIFNKWFAWSCLKEVCFIFNIN